jgi:hypothetical protein
LRFSGALQALFRRFYGDFYEALSGAVEAMLKTL